VTLSCVVWSLLRTLNYCKGFKDPEMSEQVTVGKRRHVTLPAVQKLEVMMGLESGER
jgi:hypothetical protein